MSRLAERLRWGVGDVVILAPDGVKAAHDVSDEARDERGRWTDGGGGSGEALKLYHLTNDPKFALDPKRVPLYNNTVGGPDEPGLFAAANPEPWINGYDYVRPFLVELTVPKSALDDAGAYPSEHIIPAANYGQVTINRVIPLDAYAREEYGDYGWVESHHGTAFDTGEQLPDRGNLIRPIEGYRYKGPDVRDMPKEETDRQKARVAAYLVESRGFTRTQARSALRKAWTPSPSNLKAARDVSDEERDYRGRWTASSESGLADLVGLNQGHALAEDHPLGLAINEYTTNLRVFAALEDAVEHAPATAPELWRGLVVSREVGQQILAELRAGPIEVGMSSWSRDRGTAASFAGPDPVTGLGEEFSRPGADPFPILLRLEAGARALNLEPNASDDFRSQREWMNAPGRFEAVGAVPADLGPPRGAWPAPVEVTLRQLPPAKAAFALSVLGRHLQAKAGPVDEPRDERGRWTALGAQADAWNKLLTDAAGPDAVSPMKEGLASTRVPLRAAVGAAIAAQAGLPLVTVTQFLHAWDGSSSDFQANSLALQQVISERFGVPLTREAEAAIKVWSSLEEGVRHVMDPGTGTGREVTVSVPWGERVDNAALILDATYAATQARLAAAGLEEVTLFRGVRWTDTPPELAEAGKPGFTSAEVTVRGLPGSSWSLSPTTAAGFATMRPSAEGWAVLVATVPAERVISLPMTGFGVLDEREATVLGSPMTVTAYGPEGVARIFGNPAISGSFSGSLAPAGHTPLGRYEEGLKAFDPAEDRDAAGRWTAGGGADARGLAEAVSNFHGYGDFTPEDASVIERAVAGAPPTPVPLYRGMFMTGEERGAFLKGFVEGRPVDLPLTSWSASREVAGEFASYESDTNLGRVSREDGAPVILTAAAGVRALDATPYAAEQWAFQDEWLMQGRYSVVSVGRQADPRLGDVVTLELGPPPAGAKAFDPDQPRGEDGRWSTIRLYHGTNTVALERAAARGSIAPLDPHALSNEVEAEYGLPKDSVWGTAGAGLNTFSHGRQEDPNVYLTADPRIAEMYARIGSEVLDDTLGAAYRTLHPFDDERADDAYRAAYGKAVQDFKDAWMERHGMSPVVLHVDVPREAVARMIPAGSQIRDPEAWWAAVTGGGRLPATVTHPGPVPMAWVSRVERTGGKVAAPAGRKGDLPGHEFHGNQWTGGRWASATAFAARDMTGAERRDAFYVYDAEDAGNSTRPDGLTTRQVEGEQFDSEAKAQAYADTLIANYGPPGAKVSLKVSDLFGPQATLEPGQLGLTTLLPEPGAYRIDLSAASLNQRTVIHEVCHVIGVEETGLIGHGTSFRIAYLRVLKAEMPREFEMIGAALAQAPPPMTKSAQEIQFVAHVTTPDGQTIGCFGPVRNPDVKGDLPGHAFRGNQWTGGGVSGLDKIPEDRLLAEPGSAPLAPGMIRLYHYTKGGEGARERLASIRDRGILKSSAVGERYGEPNMVWASAQQPRPDAHYVEFHASPDQLVNGPGSPGRPATQEAIDTFMARGADSGLYGDVTPEQIVSVHEPWHDHYRYIAGNPGVQAQITGGELKPGEGLGADLDKAITVWGERHPAHTKGDLVGHPFRGNQYDHVFAAGDVESGGQVIRNVEWERGEAPTRRTAHSEVDVVNGGRGTGERVFVGGSRNYRDLGEVYRAVAALPADAAVLTSATHGASAAARQAALDRGLELQVWSPVFDQPTREAAFFARDREVVDASDRLLSFYDGRSVGTAHEVAYAREAGKPVEQRVEAAKAFDPGEARDEAGRWTAGAGEPDWAPELRAAGGEINPDGTVTLYHGTTPEAAREIVETQTLRMPADVANDQYGVYGSSSYEHVAGGEGASYGAGAVVAFDAPVGHLHIDDAAPRAGGWADFRIETTHGVYSGGRNFRIVAGPVAKAAHDVADELRDERGRWTSGGASASRGEDPDNAAVRRQIAGFDKAVDARLGVDRAVPDWEWNRPYIGDKFGKDAMAASRALKDAVATDLTARDGLSYERNNELVFAWARSANDTNLDSLAIQKAAADRFGVVVGDYVTSQWERVNGDGWKQELADLRDKYKDWLHDSPADVITSAMQGVKIDAQQMSEAIADSEPYEALTTLEGDLASRSASDRLTDARAFVEAVYDNTQEQLRGMGLKELTVFRGMAWGPGERPPSELGDSTGRAGPRNVSLDQNPLSSWTLNLRTAVEFGYNLQPARISNVGTSRAVYATTVPVERVFSLPVSGPGALHEGEVILVGGQVEMRGGWINGGATQPFKMYGPAPDYAVDTPWNIRAVSWYHKGNLKHL